MPAMADPFEAARAKLISESADRTWYDLWPPVMTGCGRHATVRANDRTGAEGLR
jgi:hypothetical protein